MVKVNCELQDRIVNTFGAEIQFTICMEECAELIQAISKMKRGKDNRDNLIEEMADVLIAFSQLRCIFDISDEEINKWVDIKQLRQLKLLEDMEK